jgi:endo-1,4-beta-xylanase
MGNVAAMPNIDHPIREHRLANATIKLVHDASPLAYQDVTVEQKKHQFLFGSNWGDSSLALANGELTGKERQQAELRNERFLALFNQVTLPFYWARFEPRRGQPQTERILNAARWYQAHRCIVKGHPLCWHTLTADWLLTMSNQEIMQDQKARIRRVKPIPEPSCC